MCATKGGFDGGNDGRVWSVIDSEILQIVAAMIDDSNPLFGDNIFLFCFRD